MWENFKDIRRNSYQELHNSRKHLEKNPGTFHGEISQSPNHPRDLHPMRFDLTPCSSSQAKAAYKYPLPPLEHLRPRMFIPYAISDSQSGFILNKYPENRKTPLGPP